MPSFQVNYNQLMKRFFLLCFLIICQYCYPYSVTAKEPAGEVAPVIGRLKVTIMPEYDSRQVLVIYEGKFKDKDAFPREVLFILPKDVTRLTDVCSLSPGGQHFCQIYEIKRKEDRAETLVKLPYSDFFVDFEYAPFEAKAGETRKFDFDVVPAYPAEILEVHIQEPYRSAGFSIIPSSDDTYEKREFLYHRYKMANVKKWEPLTFSISYSKEDVRPSVDVKFSPMKQPELIEEKRGVALLVAGLIVLGILVFTSFIRSGKSRGKP